MVRKFCLGGERSLFVFACQLFLSSDFSKLHHTLKEYLDTLYLGCQTAYSDLWTTGECSGLVFDLLNEETQVRAFSFETTHLPATMMNFRVAPIRPFERMLRW